MPIITLTTDFGASDPFAGVMKGVILNIHPEAKIIEITHSISPQNIFEASFILQTTYKYFPKGTIHVCVIDPGVGSQRRPLLLESKNYLFIGPDNGLFTGILEKEEITNVIELKEKQYWLKTISQTFHGRDIFAPVAAHLALGEKPLNFGSKTDKNNLLKLQIEKAHKNQKGYIGVIQFIDHFGNIITNIPNEEINEKISGQLRNIKFDGPVLSFSEAKQDKLTSIKGSSGFLEIFVNKSSAAKATGAKINDKVEVNFS